MIATKRYLTVSVIIVAFAAIAVLLVIDEELNPEILTLVKQYNSEVSLIDNGNIYRLGIWASKEHDPYKIGLAIIADSKKTNEYKDTFLSAKALDKHHDSFMPEVDYGEHISPLMCDFYELTCLNQLWNKRQELATFLHGYEQYFLRLEGAFEYSDFKLTVKPGFSLPLNNSMFTGEGVNSLFLSNAILSFSDSYSDKAIASITKLLVHKKRLIESAPSSIDKAVSIFNFRNMLDVVSFLVSKTPDDKMVLWQSFIDVIETIDADEFSYLRQGQIETVRFYNEFFRGDFVKQKDDYLANFLALFVYKPNKTMNKIYRLQIDQVNTYQWHGDKVLKSENDKININEQFDWTNYIGETIVNVAGVDYTEFEKGALIQIFRAKVLNSIITAKIENSLDKNALLASITSPFTGTPAFLKDNKVCVEAEKKNEEPICI